MRFFLIDRITRWQVPTLAEAIKNVALSEDFFDDHFPRRPVMPGVLIVEGMAQLSGLLLEASLAARYNADAKAVLTVLERTKFRELVRPGDRLVYRAEVVSVSKDGGKVTARALCEGEPAAAAAGSGRSAAPRPETPGAEGMRTVVSTGMVFAFKYIDDPMLEAKRAALMKVWMTPV